MTFPCLICGELPVVDQPASCSAGGRVSNNTASNSGFATPSSQQAAAPPTGINRKAAGGGSGTTIRTLSKEVSDKIFQNLCRHLYVKTEPYWFIQNPGEQMPLCAICSAAVLEMYTLQTKVDQFQNMIKKHVFKLERMVADTEIASNWMATREEQENEETLWNTLPCPPLAIRIARERHHKFRLQVLQNFKTKVKQRQKLRAAGQLTDDIFDLDPHFSTATLLESCQQEYAQSQPAKKCRLDDNHINTTSTRAPQQCSNPSTRSSSTSSPKHPLAPNNASPSLPTPSNQQSQSATASTSLNLPSSISISAVTSQNEEFIDESEMSDDQSYSDVQIVCSVGPVDFLKEEHDYNSNSGDGDESTLDQGDGSFWNNTDADEMDDYDASSVTIPEGVEVVWVAPDVPLRKEFLDNLINENLKPSVFLRKLVFAVFGVKQVANSSGICGSSKAGAKPSLDRYKFEALREYTIDTYGIRENFAEQEDLNRKIRTICCDARKAIKRRNMKPMKQTCTMIESYKSSNSGQGGVGGTEASSSSIYNVDDILTDERGDANATVETEQDAENSL